MLECDNNKSYKELVKKNLYHILYDKIIPMRLKGEFCKSVMRPTILYGSECWSVDKKIEHRWEFSEEWME